nr:hypothetical protein [Tanacetum cinerariifolium]
MRILLRNLLIISMLGLVDKSHATSHSTTVQGGLPTPAALSVVTQSIRQLLTEQAGECLTVKENQDKGASSSRPDGPSSPPSPKRQKTE